VALSTNITDGPARDSSAAAVAPAGPPPTTTTSTVRGLVIGVAGYGRQMSIGRGLEPATYDGLRSAEIGVR
jgi:hypothetical protein